MSDLILSSYEKKYPHEISKRMERLGIAFIVLVAVFGVLMCNQQNGESFEMQIALNVISLGTVFFIFIYRLVRKLRRRKSIEEYALEMEQMENVLYYLDIDTSNKLGLVMDEVKGKIEYEEKEQRRFRVICYLGVATITATFSFVHFGGKGNFILSQLGSVINLFFIMYTLLLSVFHICALVYSPDRKYRWLYNMLMNVMITKY